MYNEYNSTVALPFTGFYLNEQKYRTPVTSLSLVATVNSRWDDVRRQMPV